MLGYQYPYQTISTAADDIFDLIQRHNSDTQVHDVLLGHLKEVLSKDSIPYNIGASLVPICEKEAERLHLDHLNINVLSQMTQKYVEPIEIAFFYNNPHLPSVIGSKQLMKMVGLINAKAFNEFITFMDVNEEYLKKVPSYCMQSNCSIGGHFMFKETFFPFPLTLELNIHFTVSGSDFLEAEGALSARISSRIESYLDIPKHFLLGVKIPYKSSPDQPHNLYYFYPRNLIGDTNDFVMRIKKSLQAKLPIICEFVFEMPENFTLNRYVLGQVRLSWTYIQVPKHHAPSKAENEIILHSDNAFALLHFSLFFSKVDAQSYMTTVLSHSSLTDRTHEHVFAELANHPQDSHEMFRTQGFDNLLEATVGSKPYHKNIYMRLLNECDQNIAVLGPEFLQESLYWLLLRVLIRSEADIDQVKLEFARLSQGTGARIAALMQENLAIQHILSCRQIEKFTNSLRTNIERHIEHVSKLVTNFQPGGLAVPLVSNVLMDKVQHLRSLCQAQTYTLDSVIILDLFLTVYHYLSSFHLLFTIDALSWAPHTVLTLARIRQNYRNRNGLPDPDNSKVKEAKAMAKSPEKISTMLSNSDDCQSWLVEAFKPIKYSNVEKVLGLAESSPNQYFQLMGHKYDAHMWSDQEMSIDKKDLRKCVRKFKQGQEATYSTSEEMALLSYFEWSHLDSTMRSFWLTLFFDKPTLLKSPFILLPSVMRQCAARIHCGSLNDREVLDLIPSNSTKSIDKKSPVKGYKGFFGLEKLVNCVAPKSLDVLVQASQPLVSPKFKKTIGAFQIAQCYSFCGVTPFYGSIAGYLPCVDIREHCFIRGPCVSVETIGHFYGEIIMDHLSELESLPRGATVCATGVSFYNPFFQKYVDYSIELMLRNRAASVSKIQSSFMTGNCIMIKGHIVLDRNHPSLDKSQPKHLKSVISFRKHCWLYSVNDKDTLTRPVFTFLDSWLFDNLFWNEDQALFYYARMAEYTVDSWYSSVSWERLEPELHDWMVSCACNSDWWAIATWQTYKSLVTNDDAALAKCRQIFHSVPAYLYCCLSQVLTLKEAIQYMLIKMRKNTVDPLTGKMNLPPKNKTKPENYKNSGTRLETRCRNPDYPGMWPVARSWTLRLKPPSTLRRILERREKMRKSKPKCKESPLNRADLENDEEVEEEPILIERDTNNEWHLDKINMSALDYSALCLIASLREALSHPTIPKGLIFWQVVSSQLELCLKYTDGENFPQLVFDENSTDHFTSVASILLGFIDQLLQHTVNGLFLPPNENDLHRDKSAPKVTFSRSIISQQDIDAKQKRLYGVTTNSTKLVDFPVEHQYFSRYDIDRLIRNADPIVSIK